MGPSEYADRTTAPVSEMDGAVAAALNRIADAIELLARATAGEFDRDDGGETPRQTDISGRLIR